MANKKDLWVDAGTTFKINIEYLNPDGTPINLSGYTAAFVIRKQGATTGTPLVSITTGFTFGNGTLAFSVSDETTATWTFPLGYYTLTIESPSGDKTRLLQGVLKVDDGTR